MDGYSIFSEALNVASLLSGPLIAVFAFKALSQIKVTKEIADKQAKMESYKLTMEACRDFSEVVIPSIDELTGLIESNSIDFLGKSKVKIENNRIKVDYFIKFDFNEIDFEKITPHAAKVINSISVLSYFLLSDLADEYLAYENLAPVYCSTVEMLAPVIIELPAVRGSSSIEELYVLWKERLDSDRKILEIIRNS